MARVGEIAYKTAFIGRWYFWYNLELALLHAVAPKATPLWLTRQLADEARSLDQERQELQVKIFGLIRNYGSVCAACGACCKENVQRFTAFDAAVRTGGPMPLQRYGREILSLPWMVSNGIQHTWQRVMHAVTRTPMPESAVCEHLGKKGCTLGHQERPMLCASWFCPKYLRHIEHRDLKRMAPLLRDMERLHFRAARLMRRGNHSLRHSK
ncbi:MAG: hypothetical protein KY468_10925 [Armatimonadetes bacterium]|nr:hypothetical protein [Armatimonadota bacterium]